MSPHNQRGFYGPRQVLHFAPFKQCALIIIMWVLHFAPLKQCALIIIMWVLPKFILVYGFIMPCMYCILGFYSMMNVYKIINYLGARICPTSFNHGKGSKVPFHSCSKPHQVLFSQTRTWCEGPRYAMEGKIKWPFNLLMFHMFTFWNSWKVNKGIQAPLWNGMFTKTFQAKQMSSNQLSKTTSSIHGKHLWH